MTVHFAYTVPRSPSRARRALDRALVAAHLPPLYRSGNDALIPWQYPVRAPHSISLNLLHALKEKAPVRFYNFYEHSHANVRRGDLFLGQPLPLGGFGNARPDRDDPDSVTSRAVREGGGSRFVIMPYAHDQQLVGWAKDIVARADGVIFIGGKIWEEDWETRSPFKDIHLKRRVRVDMGIDPAHYPVVKKSFNPKGQRKFLYIGHTAWYKNTAQLEQIAAAMPGFEGAHIGAGEVRGWKKLADFADLTPERMSQLADAYDIFVTASTADAQATTILEQMCFGMALACTPETGYSYDSITKLSTHDTAHNVRMLQALQQADEAELLERARANREIATTKHSWSEFCKTVCDFLEV